MKLNITGKVHQNKSMSKVLIVETVEPIPVKTVKYIHQSLFSGSNREMYFIDMPDDGFLPLDGGFVKFSVPSRIGSVGRVIGIRGQLPYFHNYFNEEIYNRYKVVIRFDDVDKELEFNEHQLSESDQTQTNYQYHQTKGMKNESIESNYGQKIAIDDYVIGIKARRLYFGTVIKINPKSVRVEPFKIRGNGYKTVTLFVDELIKIERDIDIESQVALMMLTSL